MRDAFIFICKHLHFEPRAISANAHLDDGYNVFEYESIIELFQDDEQGNVTFQIADDFYSWHDEDNMLIYHRNSTTFHIEYFVFSSKDDFKRDWLESLLNACNEKGLFMGALYNATEAHWQSEELPSNFIHAKRRYDMYKTKWHPVLSRIEGREIIDIFQNPGHEQMTYGTWLMAAPEMWLGKSSWQYFDRERILSFKAMDSFSGEETIVEQVTDDLIYVKLFDPGYWDYEKPHILELQRDFRQHSRMDEIELMLDEKVEMARKVKDVEG